jgi:hypothetical protein
VAPAFLPVFERLKSVLAKHAGELSVSSDTPTEYKLVTRSPSPFPQHKGHPLEFGVVRAGKAYVSFHLMPIYMSPSLNKQISPGLKARMQGKTCFNFKSEPEPS